jgi:hypothetical protein
MLSETQTGFSERSQNKVNPTLYKDEQLDHLADLGNVAQFVSFAPDLGQRYSRVCGYVANHRFSGPSSAIACLLGRSPEHSVNVRSFKPDQLQGNEFHYGLSDLNTVASTASRLADQGMFVIVNETVDVNDGGISGVAQGGLYEFAPGATPRIVESGAVASLEEAQARGILSRVYKLEPELPVRQVLRIEFSLHPLRRGVRGSHTILWEVQESTVGNLKAAPRWPNLFSELVGDKAFGLLIADAYGFPVPLTRVICRKIPPFVFGKSTGEDTLWMRTAPKVADPGYYPTVRGWSDPFRMMYEAPHSEEKLASLLIQEEVRARYSGAVISASAGEPLVEGVEGFGDEFMLGRAAPATLPRDLLRRLRNLHASLKERCGEVRIEWAFDGDEIWILQLQQTEAISIGQTVVPGTPECELKFNASEGLGALRDLIGGIDKTKCGICIVGSVGITSHFADLLRKSGIPSRISQS